MTVAIHTVQRRPGVYEGFQGQFTADVSQGGQPVIIQIPSFTKQKFTLMLRPEHGSTLTVDVTCSPDKSVQGNTAAYVPLVDPVNGLDDTGTTAVGKPTMLQVAMVSAIRIRKGKGIVEVVL